MRNGENGISNEPIPCSSPEVHGRDMRNKEKKNGDAQRVNA
jgi:hypothetical protein